MTAANPLSAPFLHLACRSTALDLDFATHTSHNRGSTASSATFASTSTVVASSLSTAGDDLLTPPTSPYNIVGSPVGAEKHALLRQRGQLADPHIIKTVLHGELDIHKGPSWEAEQPLNPRDKTAFSRAATWTIAFAGLAKRGRERQSDRQGQHVQSDARMPTPPAKPTRFALLRRTTSNQTRRRSNPNERKAPEQQPPLRPLFRRARSTTYARQFDYDFSLDRSTGKLAQARTSLYPPLAPLPDLSAQSSPGTPSVERIVESVVALHEFSETYKPEQNLKRDDVPSRAPSSETDACRQSIRDHRKVQRPDPPSTQAANLEATWKGGLYTGTQGRATCVLSDNGCTVAISGLIESLATSLYLRTENVLIIQAETHGPSASGRDRAAQGTLGFTETIELPPMADAAQLSAKWCIGGVLTVTVPLKPPPGPQRRISHSTDPEQVSEADETIEPRQCPTSTGVSRRMDDYRMQNVDVDAR